MMAVEPSDDPFLLYICFPDKCVRSVRVRGSDPCSALNAFVPGTPHCFIYKGELLNLNLPFSAYGVQESQTIVAIPQPPPESLLPSRFDYWKRITRDGDHFADFVQRLMSTSSRRESLRMRDVAIMRAESNPRRFKRMSQRFSDKLDALGSTQIPSVIGEPVVDLPTDPLPVLW
jgi:hypothetical protein